MKKPELEREQGYLLALLAGASACVSVPRIVRDGGFDAVYLENVAARTASERHLVGKTGTFPPATEVVDRKELLLIQRTRMEAGGAQEDTYQDDFLRSFGLAPERPYAAVSLDHENSTLAGFYDYRVKRLTLVERDWTGSGLEGLSTELGRDIEGEIVLSHELVHALQDERWDLLARSRALSEQRDSEAAWAFQALVEGDATLGGLRSVFGNLLSEQELRDVVGKCMRSKGTPEEGLRGLDLWMSELSSFPYSEGGLFVKALQEEGGWNAVNAAYERPPMTSEQILHPEKYRSDEAAILVELPEVTDGADAWHPAEVMGEFATRAMLLALSVDPVVAERAAAGWGGDSLQVARSAGRDSAPALLWETVWDSTADADEFEAAFRSLETFLVTRTAADRVRVERREAALVAAR